MRVAQAHVRVKTFDDVLEHCLAPPLGLGSRLERRQEPVCRGARWLLRHGGAWCLCGHEVTLCKPHRLVLSPCLLLVRSILLCEIYDVGRSLAGNGLSEVVLFSTTRPSFSLLAVTLIVLFLCSYSTPKRSHSGCQCTPPAEITTAMPGCWGFTTADLIDLELGAGDLLKQMLASLVNILAKRVVKVEKDFALLDIEYTQTCEELDDL